MYTWDSVPLFYQGGGMQCYGKTGATSAADFDCAASNSVAKRLCYCSSCDFLQPPSAPAAYVKLDTDGECQGWSTPASGSSPEECWALCSQSDKCAATTFFHSSGNLCARGPASLPNPAPLSH